MSDHDADQRAGATVPAEEDEAARRLAERRAWRLARRWWLDLAGRCSS